MQPFTSPHTASLSGSYGNVGGEATAMQPFTSPHTASLSGSNGNVGGETTV
jgi:hypothetical protein